MRILADEDVEFPIIRRLRQDGHVVEAVVERDRGALDDGLDRAIQQRALLLTADLDFAGYVFRDRRPAPSAGVVLYRLDDRYLPEQKAAIVGNILVTWEADRFAQRFTVIEEGKVRSRPLP